MEGFFLPAVAPLIRTPVSRAVIDGPTCLLAFGQTLKRFTKKRMSDLNLKAYVTTPIPHLFICKKNSNKMSHHAAEARLVVQ